VFQLDLEEDEVADRIPRAIDLDERDLERKRFRAGAKARREIAPNASFAGTCAIGARRCRRQLAREIEQVHFRGEDASLSLRQRGRHEHR
jgi:hypothetical protein